MAAYFKNYTKPRNIFCTQHVKFPRATARDEHGERRATTAQTSTSPLSLPGLTHTTQSKPVKYSSMRKILGLLGCDAVSLDNWFPTFLVDVVVSSSKVEMSK